MRRATAAEILPYVERACCFVAPGITLDPHEIIGEGESFIAYADGVPFLGYTIAADGSELVITTAAGRSSFDLVRALAMMADKHAAGFASIRFHTIRKGLVRKTRRYGYELAAVIGETHIMRKHYVK